MDIDRHEVELLPWGNPLDLRSLVVSLRIVSYTSSVLLRSS